MGSRGVGETQGERKRSGEKLRGAETERKRKERIWDGASAKRRGGAKRQHGPRLRTRSGGILSSGVRRVLILPLTDERGERSREVPAQGHLEEYRAERYGAGEYGAERGFPCWIDQI